MTKSQMAFAKTQNSPKGKVTLWCRLSPVACYQCALLGSLSLIQRITAPKLDFARIYLPLLTILLNLLPQSLSLHIQQIHNLLTSLTESLITSLPNINHGLHHSLQLVWQPSHNWTSASSGRVTRLLQDVFTGEAPMSPAEITNLVQCEKIECC